MINWSKPIETVDGEPARVISTDYTGYDGSNSYIVQIEGKHFARLGFFKEDGKPHGSCDRIRNVRVKREGWVLIEPPKNKTLNNIVAILGTLYVYPTEKEALRAIEYYNMDLETKAVLLQWEE